MRKVVMSPTSADCRVGKRQVLGKGASFAKGQNALEVLNKQLDVTGKPIRIDFSGWLSILSGRPKTKKRAAFSRAKTSITR